MRQPPVAPSIIDRAIAIFSPRAGLVRHYFRTQLARAYEAASPRDSWRPRRGGASANSDHQADAKRIREKARALVQNVPYIAAGMQQLVAHVVGTGIGIRFPDNPGLTKLLGEWSKVCDADGRLDLAGMQAAAYRTMEQDGEVLVRLRPRRPADGLPVPLQLQLLEVDYIDETRSTGGAGGNVVQAGIEYDLLGRVVAYWLWDQHPGEINTLRGQRMQSRRVPAEYIIHLFCPDRPGQGRGFSRLAPVITRTRDLQLYEDAEIARKNLEARLSVLASGDVTGLANAPSYGGAADAAGAQATGDLGQINSGGITQMPPGMNLTVIEPKPVAGHVDYVKYQLHIIAAGWGVTYEMMTGDMKEVNFSSARVRMLQFRRAAESTQWLILIPKLLELIVRAFVDAAELVQVDVRKATNVAYSPPKWDYVDPEAEVKAAVTEIASGLSSISEHIRRRGDNPEAVFAELDADAKRLGADGALDLMLKLLSHGNSQQDRDPSGSSKKPK